MTLEIPGAALLIHQPENLNSDSVVKVYTGKIRGYKSFNITIGIETFGEDAKGEGWVTFELNRNQAQYVINFLQAYMAETEIDPTQDD